MDGQMIFEGMLLHLSDVFIFWLEQCMTNVI